MGRNMFMSLENREPNPLGSSSTIPVPMMTSTESLRGSGLERNKGIWYLLKHNWRQLTSLAPGLILLCALGNLHVSWTIWQLLLYVFDYQNADTGALMAWFVGVAGGGLFGAILNANWSKILIYYSIAVALIPVSTTFVLHQMSSYNLLLIGRALAGILYGVTLVTLILHIADNSSQFLRRHFMWTISAINLLPTVLLAEFISTVTGFCDVTASIGVIMFALAIFTLIFMPCTYESIVFLLDNGTDLRALEIMLKLRNESRHFIRRDFNEFKMMLVEDNSDGWNIFNNGNSRPLLLILLLRLLNAILTGNCIYWLFLTNIWFDYKHWLGTMGQMTTAHLSQIVEQIFDNHTISNEIEFQVNSNTINIINSTTFDEYDADNITMLTNETGQTFPFGGNIFQEILNGIQTDEFNTDGNETLDSPGVFDVFNISTNTSFNQPESLDDLFIKSAYSFRLPVLQISQFLVIVCIIKIIVGVPFLCLAEKFQVYRNRTIFKVTISIGIINWIFFMVTLVCHIIDDSLLFTFYMAKLLSLIYGLYLLIAFSIDTIGYCELAESFSLTKRYGCIALIVMCEYLFHAIAILLIMNAVFKFYFHAVQSAVICFICYLLLRRMPNECLDCTLRSARDKHFVKMATTNN